MKNKRRLIMALLLFLIVGFAAVSTTLLVNGTLKFGANTDDFDVYFSSVVLDDNDVSGSVISTDGKKINYETNTLEVAGDTSVLEYTIINNSTHYDADVTISCNFSGNEYVTMENSLQNEVIEAKTEKSGILTATLIKTSTEDRSIEFECEVVAEAIERETIVNDAVIPNEINTYSLYGYLVDEEGNPLPNTSLVAYSDPIYTTTDDEGYFYMEGIKKGSHHLYVSNKTIEELKELNEEEVKSNSLVSTGFTTSTLNVVFESGHKVVDTIIERTKKYDVTLDINASGMNNLLHSVTKGLPYGNLPEVTREGYEFVGWYDKKQNGKKIEKEDLVTANEAYVLYANWIPTLTVSKSSVNTVYNTTTATNTLTYNGNGEITLTPEDSSIATATLSGNTITVKPGTKAGTTTIIVSAAGTDGYLAKTTTFTVTNKLTPTLTITNSAVNKKVITMTYSYNGDGKVTAESSDTKLATISAVNETNKTVTVNALAIGQVTITIKAAESTSYVAASANETFTFGDTVSSNSTAFQDALTTWGTIGPSTDANWYGSTTDANIFEPDGSYVILESVNTANYTGYYFKEKQADGTYKAPQYTDITIDFDMTSNNSDDDVLGAMIRFNPEATTNYWSGYMLYLDNHDTGSGMGAGAYNGLWRANNDPFNTTFPNSGVGTMLTPSEPSKIWARNKWQHYKIQAVGNTITVWRWDTNATGEYVVNDAAILFQYTDTSSEAISAGTYGFWCYSQPYAQFKNFTAITGNSDSFDITVN